MVMSLMISMWGDGDSPTARGIAKFVPQEPSQALNVTATAVAVVVVELLQLERMSEDLVFLPQTFVSWVDFGTFRHNDRLWLPLQGRGSSRFAEGRSTELTLLPPCRR
jgi:hypothetical protein